MKTNLPLGAALALGESGWHVHPCDPRDGPHAKAPLTARGHLDASTDPAVIAAWWRRFPAALVGAAIPESLAVVDIDPRNGGGIAALEGLAGHLGSTLTVWSGRGDGGCHLYYLRPLGEVTRSRLPSGIDLKLHGYMIMPPSLHPSTGAPYRWEQRAIAPMPRGLRELLLPAPPARFLRPTGAGAGHGPALAKFVRGLPAGQRNRGLFWAACRAAENDLRALEAELLAAAAVTGLPEREARRVLASAARTIGGAG